MANAKFADVNNESGIFYTVLILSQQVKKSFNKHTDINNMNILSLCRKKDMRAYTLSGEATVDVHAKKRVFLLRV
jgi:hypothetical protein